MLLRRDVLRTHKLTEGTGPKSLLLWRNPMAQVTYRGVTYDTENRPNRTVRPAEHVEVYRGVKFLVDTEGHKRVLTAV